MISLKVTPFVKKFLPEYYSLDSPFFLVQWRFENGSIWHNKPFSFQVGKGRWMPWVFHLKTEPLQLLIQNHFLPFLKYFDFANKKLLTPILFYSEWIERACESHPFSLPLSIPIRTFLLCILRILTVSAFLSFPYRSLWMLTVTYLQLFFPFDSLTTQNDQIFISLMNKICYLFHSRMERLRLFDRICCILKY